MKHSTPTRIRVERDVVTRVRRVLSGNGQFKVSVGQEVTPDEIIGSAETPSGFRIINLSKLLEVAPKDTEKYLTRKIGQKIYKDELLAYKKEWFLTGKKMVVSPSDGRLDFLNPQSGELKISLLPKKIELPAGVYGIVELVNQEQGQVIIRTEVSRIYGVCGSGRFRDGTLRILGKQDHMVSEAKIGLNYAGQILVNGSLIFKNAVSAAISSGVTGIITGGINAEDYKGMAGGRIVFPKKLDNDIGISVVVCEGFGPIPIGEDIFEVFSMYEGKFVFIDGNKAVVNLPSFSSSCLVKIKNTKLPPLQGDDLAENLEHTKGISELEKGMNVRIVGNAYPGEQGKLMAIDDAPTLLPSKIKTYLATIETKRRKLQVPVANLEIIM